MLMILLMKKMPKTRQIYGGIIKIYPIQALLLGRKRAKKSGGGGLEAIVVSVRLLNHGRFLDNFVFSAVCLRDGEFFAKSVSDKRILSENLILCKYQITLDAFYSIKKTLFRRGGGKNLAIKIVKGTVSCKLSTKIENLRCWSMYCLCQKRTYIVSVHVLYLSKEDREDKE